jgi:hypothetical protein
VWFEVFGKMKMAFLGEFFLLCFNNKPSVPREPSDSTQDHAKRKKEISLRPIGEFLAFAQFATGSLGRGQELGNPAGSIGFRK